MDYMDPVLLVNILQFLATVYQISNPNETIVHVLNEVTTEVKNESPADGVRFVNERLQQRLGSNDAITIGKDISLLEALFSFKATPESFNYFGILADVFKNVVAFCSRMHIFKLRGGMADEGRALLMKRTAAAIYTPGIQRGVASLFADQTPIETRAELFLLEEMTKPNTWRAMDVDDVLPLISSVKCLFKKRQHWDDSMSHQVDDIGLLYVGRAKENHWISFIPDMRIAMAVTHSVMLRSSDVKAIVDAVAEDIFDYVNDVKADQDGNTALNRASDNLRIALKQSKE
jgi:hypothetical protein